MSQKRIVLGVTGGVAAYKSVELVRLLIKASYEVQVVMTEAATKFVGPVTFQAVSGRPVFVDLWDGRAPNNMAHIDLTRGAHAIVVAPATSDFMAKVANGFADDLLSTLVAARDCPLLLAPAMNRQMWENPPNQRNLAQLISDGVHILGPGEGEQACGEVGLGRMLEPEALLQHIDAFFQLKLLSGKRVLITAGPTFERIDAVRGITNSSSGKMGYAIARAAWESGADVVLVSGETALPVPLGCRRIDVVSAEEMLQAVNAEVEEADIFISVAAVSDYYVLNPSEQKIKKDAHILTLELGPNPDILANITARENPPFCVGFAAESENLLEYAEAKRKRKKLPLLAANLVQNAMGADENEIILLDDDGETRLTRAPKLDVARRLIAHIARLYQKR
ncbi:bifunctional phosphopantothenoylcysteine decarboxylase/phosphopantothenate--cysteine ligase CoaBC [Iodobacter fluviatilis]|uniref:Coenzyme A biosynthesis bifunctional protein CoaBC n=1 Tax=Iodobacter fluviatilis TaxID=537 RepID=A0A377Q6L0_9NEIS|nr:bifunctional phosphopantothenoylcysteine decarboxylase/phosphopantothenate--cysteine ligase CoaBC [Iodobacter fluviatilis]TCU89546.1 phosphopantothenate-cysteine ligase /phosphopantothenoylcysteine decarboxylase [Iodobacter fluviatilis]STQ90916.1 DNA/pantothenate metabolism flavoprotein [Iodobacter fluviatilis]